MKKTSFALLIMGTMLIAGFLPAFTARPHQPEISSTMLVERNDGAWVLQVRAALLAFEYEVHTHFGKDSYKTPEEFNGLVIRHLMEHISITANDQDSVSLQNGAVKLGHEASVVFELQGMPKKMKTVTVSNSGFQDIHDNQGALIIVKKGFKKQQFLLNNQNAHSARLKIVKNQFELQ